MKTKKQTTKTESKEMKDKAGAEKVVGNMAGTRGRIFEGTIIKKFPGRVVIVFDRTVYLQKYERFYKKRSKMHARIPAGMNLEIGDYIKIQECRPLSKIIHAMVIEKVRSADNKSIGEKK